MIDDISRELHTSVANKLTDEFGFTVTADHVRAYRSLLSEFVNVNLNNKKSVLISHFGKFECKTEVVELKEVKVKEVVNSTNVTKVKRHNLIVKF